MEGSGFDQSEQVSLAALDLAELTKEFMDSPERFATELNVVLLPDVPGSIRGFSTKCRRDAGRRGRALGQEQFRRVRHRRSRCSLASDQAGHARGPDGGLLAGAMCWSDC